MAEERHVAFPRGDGTRIAARIREGNGPALVFIPGTWGNMHTRGPLMELLDPDLTLVNVALPGQDDNWPPPVDPSIPAFARDVMRLADGIGLDRFFVGGQSLGGMISVELCRIAENRLRGAISVEGWTHHEVAQDAFGGDIDGALTPDRRARLAEIRHELLDRWDPALRTRYGTIWKEWDGSDVLATTSVPVLEIWGDRGRPAPSRAAMRIPERPNIEVVWVAGASHNLHVEAPDVLAREIDRFIRACGA